jgi:dihydrofolate synthase/folylpolyglutamate synthase
MNYASVLQLLEKIKKKGYNLDKQNVKEIINNFPFGLEKIKFIQIAGTNGKGSTAFFLTSILQEAGHKVGLFTSPHLKDIRERITINRKLIPKTDFTLCFLAIKEIAQELMEKKIIDGTPTYFEYTFLTALYYFYKRGVNIGILEVGLGGRFDATSSITPEISVITGISLDHTSTLGKYIKDIAYEKAGIIKEGIPVVCGCNVHSVSHKVIKKRAHELHAPFHNVFNYTNKLQVEAKRTGYHCQYNTEAGEYLFDVHVNGIHQTKNAATAVKVVEQLNHMGQNISIDSIYNGIKRNQIPARIETMNTQPPVILDGGHNVESIKVLKEYLERKGKNCLTLIFGVLKDKNYQQMVRLLLPFIERVIVTEPISMRALPAEHLSRYFHKSQVKKVLTKKYYSEALEIARSWKEEILITGSFYLVGEMRDIIIHGG